MKGYLKTYRIDGREGYDPKTFINKIKPIVLNLIDVEEKPIKVKFNLVCELIKEAHSFDRWGEISNELTTILGYFASRMVIITDGTDFTDLFDQKVEEIYKAIAKFQKRGSGWVFNKVLYIDISINPYEPFKGSSYIPLTDYLAAKKTIINVKNEKDNECFRDNGL